MKAEYVECALWSAACFISGVSLREFAPDEVGKWIGRVSVLTAFFLMSSFGNRAMSECGYQSARKQNDQVVPANANPVSSLVAFRRIEATTPGGNTIEWDENGQWSVLRAGKRGGLIRNNSGSVNSELPGGGHVFDAMSYDERW